MKEGGVGEGRVREGGIGGQTRTEQVKEGEESEGVHRIER